MKVTLLVLIATTLFCSEGFASELKGIVKTQAGEPLADVFIFYGRSMRDITHMRGRAKDGTYWRYVGAVGESIQYSGLTEQEAKYFDTIIDTACY